VGLVDRGEHTFTPCIFVKFTDDNSGCSDSESEHPVWCESSWSISDIGLVLLL